MPEAGEESGSGLTSARWTHVALPSSDLDASIAFYTSMTPLVVVAVREDAAGRSAWLSNEGQWRTPFVLVLVDFARERGARHPIMTPFAHLGIEVPRRADVDDAAARARAAGCLHWEPQDLPDPVGYVCALTDPDGNVIEISHGQRVFSTVRDLWGPRG
ncbi:Glyoxalase/bleomycin resistance protein/dioxygenase [Parafrankia sp. EAN1pec]|uniref:VOC family protein n=1 Tax=Parafrankia sp. (strain EAN1pec) TaxID=298653 RepID=UPI0000541449|nr:Glyoxalase/bleomycin resistance protein/dioxygenase [Frankia sp. EAN1pec]